MPQDDLALVRRPSNWLVGAPLCPHAFITADRVATIMLAVFVALMFVVFSKFSLLTFLVWWLCVISLFVLSLFYFYFLAAGNE
jgi:hypothetical protein